MKTRKVMGNTDVAHYQGRQSIYNICILNYCKLTFEFFKNYIFEKRRQFLNRIRAAKDGGQIKQQRVFRTKNSKFKNWHRTPIFEPALVSAASTDGRGIKAHDVCIKTVQDARF